MGTCELLRDPEKGSKRKGDLQLDGFPLKNCRPRTPLGPSDVLICGTPFSGASSKHQKSWGQRWGQSNCRAEAPPALVTRRSAAAAKQEARLQARVEQHTLARRRSLSQ